MTLETAQSPPLENVTAADLSSLISDAALCGEFMILSKAGQVYIQAAGMEPPFSLEYRDGGEDHHFKAPDVQDRKELERVFLWYLTDDPRWRLLVHWKKMDFYRKLGL
jgi:hypothetical protein